MPKFKGVIHKQTNGAAFYIYTVIIGTIIS